VSTLYVDGHTMKHDKLEIILSDLYSDNQGIERILNDIGIDSGQLNLNAAPISIWSTVLGKLRYQEAKLHRLLITVGNEYGVLDRLLPAYEGYLEKSMETNTTMFTSPVSNVTPLLTDMQQDVKSLRKDLDDFKLETKVELTRVSAKLTQVDENLDQLTIVNRVQQNDAKIGRNLLYIILGVILLFIILVLAANMGIVFRG